MKLLTTVLLCISYMICAGQSTGKLILKGEYSPDDSLKITRAYFIAKEAVEHMYHSMSAIWNISAQPGQNIKVLRKERWKKEALFMIWLGQPEKIGTVRRKINRIYAKFDKKIIMEVTRENKGRCTGWISAWVVPFGQVRIRLCEDFFIYRTHLQEKVIIHELGHEAGMFLHRKIHGCRAAKRAAILPNRTTAKRNPENYAWLAMSYLGLKCSH